MVGMSETKTSHCRTCGAMPDSTGLHHSVSCPERSIEGELSDVGVDSSRYKTPFGDFVFIKHNNDPEPPDPPDLLPLILLELRKVNAVLPFIASWSKSANLGSKITKRAWEKQMKDLGHWDERYDD